MEQKPKKSFYNKERYERNKEEILKNRREKYRTQHNKDLESKEKCHQCNILKNLLDEKGIQYHYLDFSKTTTN
jgi:hypothetical protein